MWNGKTEFTLGSEIEQATSSSNLVIEMFNPKETRDTRAKIIVQEETSSANPYGKIQLDYLLQQNLMQILYTLAILIQCWVWESQGMQLSDMSSMNFLHLIQTCTRQPFNLKQPF